jgi:dipeptidyl aminopeptidase/acylaminoacyl peptidase
LVLISPYTSIRGIVKDLFLGPLAQFIIADRFNNLDMIKKVKCPTFILHGQKDEVINLSHS